jgi:hypothetical protein
LRAKSFPHHRRRRGLFPLAVAAIATLLLYQPVATLIVELLRLMEGLK